MKRELRSFVVGALKRGEGHELVKVKTHTYMESTLYDEGKNSFRELMGTTGFRLINDAGRSKV